MSYEQEPMRVVGDRIISERQYQQEQRELAWLEFLHTQSDKGDEDEYYQHCIENNIQYYTRAERVQRIKDLIARSEKEAQRSDDIAMTICVLSTLGVLALLVKGCTMLQ